MYTTQQKVRDLSGLYDTVNIPPATIRGKITIASSMVDGAICRKYLLPLAYRRQNMITFSGAGLGAANLTATINGTDYTIPISNGLTAKAAADLFRAEVYGNSDFIADYDEDGDDGIITIISLGDSSNLVTANAQVNITEDGGTVQGITATAGTRYDRYPPMVDQMTAEIAATLLLLDSYGIEGQDSVKDGDKRMNAINKILMQVQGKDESLPDFKLMDEVTREELTTSGNTPNFFPTNASRTDPNDPTAPQSTMNKIF